MPKITDNIAVNGNAGAFVSLSSSIPARKVVIDEDPVNGTQQGLNYQLASENFAVTHQLAAGEQLVLGNTVAHGNAQGSVLGWPARTIAGDAPGVAHAADVYAKIQSNTAVATAARMNETE